jgi:HSP20 family protein
LPSLRFEVDRLFDTLVHTAWGGASPDCWNPAIDVSEDSDLYRLEMDVPGVSASGLSITAEGGMLRIEGSRQRVRRSNSERHHVVERTCGRFLRTFRLPVDADVEGIRVRLSEGVLTVEIPRQSGRRSSR